MRILKTLAATLAVAGFATAASAADLPARMYTKAPAIEMYNWTGFYAGVNAGGGWTRNGNFGDASGFVGGGQIGYNWQGVGSPLVLGLEADFQGTSIHNSATVAGVTGEARIPAFGTIRGRVGYAWDRFMVYGTGGFAYTDTKATVTGPAGSVSDNKWASGYTLGGGIEWAFMPRWSVGAEYLYVHAPSRTLTLAGVPVSTGDYNYNVLRAKLNYRF